jgi:hypothetical protein
LTCAPPHHISCDSGALRCNSHAFGAEQVWFSWPRMLRGTRGRRSDGHSREAELLVHATRLADLPFEKVNGFWR